MMPHHHAPDAASIRAAAHQREGERPNGQQQPPSPDNTGKATSGTVPANAAVPGASAAAPETKANAGAPAKSGGKPNGRTATRRTSAAKSSAHDNSAHAKKSDGEAVAMLKQDHRRVEKLFAEYEKAGDDRKDAIIQDVCHALTLHTMLEEEVFYRPAAMPRAMKTRWTRRRSSMTAPRC
jgi:hypothetical protein